MGSEKASASEWAAIEARSLVRKGPTEAEDLRAVAIALDAARQAGREDAAKVAEAYRASTPDPRLMADSIAAAIRDLAPDAPEGGGDG